MRSLRRIVRSNRNNTRFVNWRLFSSKLNTKPKKEPLYVTSIPKLTEDHDLRTMFAVCEKYGLHKIMSGEVVIVSEEEYEKLKKEGKV